MYRQVQSNIILKSAMEDILRATWAAHNGLAGALPVREVHIYSAGFLAALQAVGLAVGVDWQDAPTVHQPVEPLTRFPVRESLE
jgi:hypothetical protein